VSIVNSSFAISGYLREQELILYQGFWAATLGISYQFQNLAASSASRKVMLVAGNFIHNMAEAGNTAVLAGDDFAAGFLPVRFAAPQFFVAV